jgi:hypothetical protein
MIIDRDEAFRHNSCKKLAQLGKVIFSLTSAARDKADDSADITGSYEEAILRLFARHRKQAEEVYSGLVRFRKSCIDKYCVEYGVLYKQMKSDYSTFLNQQTRRIVTITNEMKTIKTSIRQIEDETQTTATGTVAAIDEMFIAVRSPPVRSHKSQRNKAASATAEITERTKAVVVQFEVNLKAMVGRFNAEKSELKAQFTVLTKGAVKNHVDEFRCYRKDIGTMKDNAIDLRNQFTGIMAEHMRAARQTADARATLVEAVAGGAKQIQTQKATICVQIRSVTQKHDASVVALEKSSESERKTQKSQLDSIVVQIEEIRKKLAKLNASDTSMPATAAAHDNGCQKEIQRIKDSHAAVQKEAKMVQQNVDNFRRQTCEWVNNSLEKLAMRSAMLKERIERADVSRREEFARRLRIYEDKQNDRLRILEIAIQVQNELREQKNKEELDVLMNLQSEIPRQNDSLQQEFESATAKVEKELKDYELVMKGRRDDRVKELDAAFERRKSEWGKKLDDVKQKFRQDQLERTKIYRLPHLTTPSDGDRQAQQDFEIQKGKMSGLLTVLTTQIDALHADADTALARFNTELTSIDKGKRQLQRRMETETRAIDDEYERKIQIAQVDLQKTIDHIATFYNDDENRRGCEVIELMRKVTESRNRTDDLLKRKEKELANLRRENLEEEDQLRRKIEQLKAKSQTNCLEQQLSDGVLSMQNDVKAIENATAQRLAEIDRSIEKVVEDTESAKRSVQAETDDQIGLLVKQAAAYDDRRLKNEKAKQEEMSRIQATSNKMAEEIARKTVVEFDRIRKRINMAGGVRGQMEEDNDSAFSKGQDQFGTKIEIAAADLWRNIQTSAINRKQRLESLDAQIIDLRRTCRDMDASMLDIPGRKEEHGRVGIMETEIATQTTDISSKFELLIWLLEHGPEGERRTPRIASKTSFGRIPLPALV